MTTNLGPSVPNQPTYCYSLPESSAFVADKQPVAAVDSELNMHAEELDMCLGAILPWKPDYCSLGHCSMYHTSCQLGPWGLCMS